MEQLTAIVHDDPETNICVGYRDLSPDGEFWHAGHMPGIPLMPGVMVLRLSPVLCWLPSRQLLSLMVPRLIS